MKNIKTGLLISLLMFHPFVSAAGENDSDPGTNNGLGFGIGALVGGLLAGPPGFIIGAASGAAIGDRHDRKDQEIAELEKTLNEKSIELAYQQNELEKTRAGFEDEFQKVMLNREIQALEKLSQGISYVIYYRTNEAAIRTEVMPRIQQLAELVQPYPEIQIRVEGFADERGSDDYNLALSKQRIEQVRAALIESGIQPGRIQTQAFGEKQTTATQGDNEGYVFDRRVTINLTLDREV